MTVRKISAYLPASRRGQVKILLHSACWAEGTAGMIQIDDTDRRILATLQKEGRISNADLA